MQCSQKLDTCLYLRNFILYVYCWWLQNTNTKLSHLNTGVKCTQSRVSASYELPQSNLVDKTDVTLLKSQVFDCLIVGNVASSTEEEI